MELNLKGKVVAITGGAGGIGLRVALAFAKEGSIVAACDLSDPGLAAARETFEKEGFELYTENVNLQKPEEITRFANNVYEKFGHLDVWINNAGVNRTKPFKEVTLDDWDFIFNTDVRPVFWAIQTVSDIMIKQGGGVIINTASYSGVMGTSRAVPYSAGKAAVLSMTKTTAGALAPYGIRVNAVVPATVRTGIIASRIKTPEDERKLAARMALQRIAEPEELGPVYTFLASEASGYITGTAVEVSGGKYCIQDPETPWTLAGK